MSEDEAIAMIKKHSEMKQSEKMMRSMTMALKKNVDERTDVIKSKMSYVEA